MGNCLFYGPIIYHSLVTTIDPAGRRHRFSRPQLPGQWDVGDLFPARCRGYGPGLGIFVPRKATAQLISSKGFVFAGIPRWDVPLTGGSGFAGLRSPATILRGRPDAIDGNIMSGQKMSLRNSSPET